MHRLNKHNQGLKENIHYLGAEVERPPKKTTRAEHLKLSKIYLFLVSICVSCLLSPLRSGTGDLTTRLNRPSLLHYEVYLRKLL